MFNRYQTAKHLLASTVVAACAAFMVSANAQLANYSQNFESLDQASPTALTDDGWLIFANVFDPSGSIFLYNYGVFGAPNGGPGFSGITTGEGGPDQGANQLTVYNDYNNGDHANGFQIEASVFQEQTISAADVGKTFTFQFDAKKGNIEAPSAAVAFIKTLDPGAGFFVTNFLTVNTENLPDTWNTFSIEILIDAALEGQILQFGFATTTSNFTPSGNFYDNITFNDGVIDTDGDGVDDSLDNCTLRANPDQRDTNGDGYGNVCDPDFDNNGVVNFLDISSWIPFFNTACGDVDQDINGDGGCNFGDFSTITQFFNQPPGPSGIAP